MSINATIDETKYTGIETIFAFGKTIQLEEIKDSTGESGEITVWNDSSEYSFGGIIKKVRQAKATGTFSYQMISTEYVQMFDTGLGDNWEGIFIIDENGEIITTSNIYYSYFSFISKDGYCLIKHHNILLFSAGDTDLSNGTYLKIENGIYYAKSRYTSDGYQPFKVGNTYRWFAW